MKNLIEKAETLLDHSRSIIRNNDGISPEAAEMIAEAHAVATLALAEQQRVANLLKYAWTWPMARPELRDQIEKELGL